MSDNTKADCEKGCKREETELADLRAAVRRLLDGVNARYPEKNPREWTCPNMAKLDRMVPPPEELPTPPEGWPTNEERTQLWFMLNRVRRSGYFAAEDVEAILSRSGPPTVVEVPDMSPATYGFDSPFSNGQYRAGYRQACLMHRDALDKAGVPWEEVPDAAAAK